MLYAYGKNKPKIAKGCFIAPSADVIGKVEIGDGSSVWFGAVLRGDMDGIRIGKNVSVQDNSVLHTEKGVPCEVSDNVAIGHRAIVHSSIVGSNCIIGMGAVLLSRSKIGNNCIIGAGSVVTEGMEIPDNSIAIGAPAKVIKQVTPEHLERIKRNIASYEELAASYGKKGVFGVVK